MIPPDLSRCPTYQVLCTLLPPADVSGNGFALAPPATKRVARAPHPPQWVCCGRTTSLRPPVRLRRITGLTFPQCTRCLMLTCTCCLMHTCTRCVMHACISCYMMHTCTRCPVHTYYMMHTCTCYMMLTRTCYLIHTCTACRLSVGPATAPPSVCAYRVVVEHCSSSSGPSGQCYHSV